MQLHGLEVGDQRMALLDRRFLVAKEELGRPQAQRIVAAVEDVAQDDMHHLFDEERRDVHRAAEEA